MLHRPENSGIQGSQVYAQHKRIAKLARQFGYGRRHRNAGEQWPEINAQVSDAFGSCGSESSQIAAFPQPLSDDRWSKARGRMARFIGWILPGWVNKYSVDPSHSHGRRFTRAYKRKKEIVKLVWVGSGATMLLFPAPAFIVALALFITFLSFVILDETA